MKISYLPTNHIANMEEGENISMQTLVKICVILNCDITDVIELISDSAGGTR